MDGDLHQAIPELEVRVHLRVREVIGLGLLDDLLGFEAVGWIAPRRSDNNLLVAPVGALEELDHLLGGLLELAHRDDTLGGSLE